MATATPVRPPIRGLGARGIRGRRVDPLDAVTLVIALALIAIVVVPLARVLIGMFWVDGALTVDPIVRTLAVPDLGPLILNTLLVVAGSSLAALVIGVPLAWLNERTDARMGALSDALPLLPFLLPPVAGAVGWTMLLAPRAGLANSWLRDALAVFGVRLESGPFDINSWYGLIMVYTFYAVPFVYMNAAASLRNLDSSLEEASRLSGASAWRTLIRVVLPSVAPGIGAGLLLAVWFGFGMFSIPSIVGSPAGIDVLSVRIVELLTFTYPPDTDVAIGLSGFIVLFVGLAYLLQARLLRKGRFATMTGKGGRPRITRLGAWKWPLRGLVGLYVFVSTLLPVVALVLVSLNGFWTPKIDWSGLSLDALRLAVVDDLLTREALANSLGLGLVGGLIGILAAAMIALYVARRRTVFARVVDASIKLPAAVSNMVIAVGVLLLLAAPPFNLSGTLAILLIGYLALYLPQASIAADAAVSGVGSELPEASAVAGASPVRTFVRVLLPLMVPGLVAGWALLFIRIVGDLTASAILSGTGNPVVGFRILEVFNGGSYALLAALSTVLVLITGTVLAIVLAYTRRRSRFGITAKVG
ncbi:iron ABC transporter permease [Agromyces sp. NPDC049794]|uniref:ABC transporter permease n=1 Tax=unclassified Agromyces TaxID=2639701 RepID=UPI0033D98CE2